MARRLILLLLAAIGLPLSTSAYVPGGSWGGSHTFPYGYPKDTTEFFSLDPAPDLRFGYQGKPREKDTPLWFFGARYHHQGLGRWLTPDPVESADPLNPHTWNRYGFVDANPMSFVDPDGRQTLATFRRGRKPIVRSDEYLNASRKGRLQIDTRAANAPEVPTPAELLLDPGPVSAEFLTSVGLGGVAAGIAAVVTAGDLPDPGDILESGGRLIYRRGKPSPSNLRPRAGEDALSFRDSLSNPVPRQAEQEPVFRHGDDYFAVDTSKLPDGAAVVDNVPPGHVSVRGVDPQTLRDAVVDRGRFPRE